MRNSDYISVSVRRAVHRFVAGPARDRQPGLRSYSRNLTPILLLLMLAGISLSSCRSALMDIRSNNAAMVLRNYRNRPLAAANNGYVDLTLHDARRIALTNSLDIQTAIWKERVKGQEAFSQRVRMLPKLEFEYDLTIRDRLQYSRSDVLGKEGLWEAVGPGSGTGVTNFSTGRERGERRWKAKLKWSPMDAAMARYLARKKYNEATSSRYQRVRTAQKITAQVTAAFYRLLTASTALPKANRLVADREAIVRDMEALGRWKSTDLGKGLVSKEDYFDARKSLERARKRLGELHVNLGQQRSLLAETMNVSPDSQITVRGRMWPLPQYSMDMYALERVALLNRPEAYQADLDHMSSIEEHRRLIVKLFPRVQGHLHYVRDENKYLLNKNFVDGGMKITWDLMKFTSDYFKKNAAGDDIARTDRDRAAISLGILTDVRLRTLDVREAMDDYRKYAALRDEAAEELRIAKDIEDVKQESASGQRRMLIKQQEARCQLLESEIYRLEALGDLHGALAEQDAAIGTNHPVGSAGPPAGRIFRSLPSARPGLLNRAGRFARSLAFW